MAQKRSLAGRNRGISFKKGSAGYAKRREVAEAIARKKPGISMERKFRIATAAVQRSGAKRPK